MFFITAKTLANWFDFSLPPTLPQLGYNYFEVKSSPFIKDNYLLQ